LYANIKLSLLFRMPYMPAMIKSETQSLIKSCISWVAFNFLISSAITSSWVLLRISYISLPAVCSSSRQSFWRVLFKPSGCYPHSSVVHLDMAVLVSHNDLLARITLIP
jgi:hypothetical protein